MNEEGFKRKLTAILSAEVEGYSRLMGEDGRFPIQLPKRVIGDKVYDSDPLDERLEQLGVQMITPHKVNRKKPKT